MIFNLRFEVISIFDFDCFPSSVERSIDIHMSDASESNYCIHQGFQGKSGDHSIHALFGPF
jgi:hypothetical protein